MFSEEEEDVKSIIKYHYCSPVIVWLTIFYWKKDKIQMLIINFLENPPLIVMSWFSLIGSAGKLIRDKGYSHNRLEWDTKLEKKSTEKDKGSYFLLLGDTFSQQSFGFDILCLMRFQQRVSGFSSNISSCWLRVGHFDLYCNPRNSQ